MNQGQVKETIPSWKQEYAGEFASGKSAEQLLKDLDDERQLLVVNIILENEELYDLTLAERQAEEKMDYLERLAYLYSVQDQEYKMNKIKK